MDAIFSKLMSDLMFPGVKKFIFLVKCGNDMGVTLLGLLRELFMNTFCNYFFYSFRFVVRSVGKYQTTRYRL